MVAIWGGSADPRRGVPWTERTVTPLASTSKALASVAVLTLVERGLIDLDRPVAHYWPAFGQAGKSGITVDLVLSHRSGVAALDQPVTNDEAAALDPVLRRIERQRPWWPPGTRHGYHAVTYGFLLSGLVRSVTGRTVGELFAREVAEPLGATPLHRRTAGGRCRGGTDDRAVAAAGARRRGQPGLAPVRRCPWSTGGRWPITPPSAGRR